ncbi:MAG TPA: hypothetical protein VGI64_10005 [Streptosporangiaceae bacterium]|jgi:hypothetical protein
MGTHGDPVQTDTQGLTDTDTYLYETIATLEYTGRPATRSQIAAAADLDDQALDQALAKLTQRGLLTSNAAAGESSFEPAERGWSAAPDQAHGMPH